jgi:hypothetical protein
VKTYVSLAEAISDQKPGAVAVRYAWELYEKLTGADKQIFDELWESEQEKAKQRKEADILAAGKSAIEAIQAYERVNGKEWRQ